MSTSHIAGTVVTFNKRYVRQICEWCGHVLVDVDLERSAVSSEDGNSTIPTWTVDAWVRIDGHVSQLVEREDQDEAPEDACIRSGGSTFDIVRELAESDPETSWPSAFGCKHCLIEAHANERTDEWRIDHKPDCLWLRAKKAVE